MLNIGDRVTMHYPKTPKEIAICRKQGYLDWRAIPEGAQGTIICTGNHVHKYYGVNWDIHFNGTYPENKHLNVWYVAAFCVEPHTPKLEQLIQKIKYLDNKYENRRSNKI